MPIQELVELAKTGNLDAFESRCLEGLGSGVLTLSALVTPFAHLEQIPPSPRMAALGQMVLDNTKPEMDPHSALRVVRVTLLSDGENVAMRQRAADLYKQAYPDVDMDKLIEHSGLLTGRPVRNAMRLLDLCATLKPDEALVSRTEGAVVQVKDTDYASGLITVKRGLRSNTLTISEVVREYERTDPNDFRVLRQLHPDRLAQLIETDPVALVIGLIHAHGEAIDQDLLKEELVPKYIQPAKFSEWWTKAKAKFKKSPNIVMEGRTKVVLHYTAAARTLEEDTWEAFEALKDPVKWLALVDGYIREKKADKLEPSADLLKRCRTHMVKIITPIREKRPADALAAALMAAKIALYMGADELESEKEAIEILKSIPDPAPLIAKLPSESFQELALSALQAARGEEAGKLVVPLVPVLAASLQDRLMTMTRKAGQTEAVQVSIDACITDPIHNTEILYWLWKGPRETEGLRLPSDDVLFGKIIDTLSALGRSLSVPESLAKSFRLRMRAAIGLRDYARAIECLKRVEASRAVTMRNQFMQLERSGDDNMPIKLLDVLRTIHPELWKAPDRRLSAWEEPDVIWTSKIGLEKRTAERDHLVNVTMRENAKRIGEAASFGDLSENSEYKFALEERDMLRARLAGMNAELSQARVIEPQDIPMDHVGIGSKVALRRTDNGHVDTLTLLGSFDSDLEKGIYNYRAPFALKLMGTQVGDKTRVALDGTETEYEVISITNGLTQVS